MKAIRLDKFVKSYDELKVSEVELPEVPYGHALVQVKAVGLNFVDLLYARGKHQNNISLHRPPFTLGTEFSGIIQSTNPPALPNSSFSPLSRIYGSHLGAFASYICVPLISLRPIPPSWTFTDAAGISSTLPVSYGALRRADVKSGETVLVHAAVGGLGLMAVQIAKAMGCVVIGTASSASKLAIAKEYGADYVVNYSNEGWVKEVLDITGGKGVDVVYDPVGLVDLSLKCLAHFGRILLIGFAGREGNMEKIAMNRLLLRQAKVIGYRFGETDRRRSEETKEIWRALDRMITKGEIRPTVYGESYVGLGSMKRAMRDMADRKVWGKAVIVVDDAENIGKIEAKAKI